MQSQQSRHSRLPLSGTCFITPQYVPCQVMIRPSCYPVQHTYHMAHTILLHPSRPLTMYESSECSRSLPTAASHEVALTCPCSSHTSHWHLLLGVDMAEHHQQSTHRGLSCVSQSPQVPPCGCQSERKARAHPVTTAGPKALAGLMHMLLMGPTSHMSSRMATGTARGPSLGPHPLQDTSVTASTMPRAEMNLLAIWLACIRHAGLVGLKDAG